MKRRKITLTTLFLLICCLFLAGVSIINSAENLSLGTVDGIFSLNPDRWVRVFGENVTESPASILSTGDGGYIMAISTYNKISLIKLDGEGDEDWEKIVFERPFCDVEATCMQRTREGDYVIAGRIWYIVGTNSEEDILLIKVDENGNTIWSRTIGKRGYEEGATWVEQTRDGGYIIVGERYGEYKFPSGLLVKTDRNGSEIWNKTFGDNETWVNLYCVRQTTDGDYIAVGFIDNLTSRKALLIKIDEDGNIIWERRYGRHCCTAFYVQQTTDGGYVLAGEDFYYKFYGWVIKTDDSGNIEWNTTLYTRRVCWDSSVYLVKQTRDGYIVAGFQKGVTPSSLISFLINPEIDFLRFQAWLIKLDRKGNIEWEKRFHILGHDTIPADILQTRDGGYIILGELKKAGRWNDMDVILIKTDEKGQTNFLQLMLCGIVHDVIKKYPIVPLYG